jgi:hypothetical protein
MTRKSSSWAVKAAYGVSDVVRVACVLEEADGGDTGGACLDAGVCVAEGDAADGEHGNGERAATLFQALCALRRAERLL